MIIDLIYSRYVLGFAYWEYFVFGLEDTSIAERLEFMSLENSTAYNKVLNTGHEDIRKLRNKYLTYQALTPYFKRDMCYIQGDEQKDEFFEFCRRHPQFFVKPVDSLQGRRTEIVNREDYKSQEELFAALLEKGGTSPKILCEELIICEDSIRAIHPESVNSVRIYTYLKTNGDPTLVSSFIKAGQSGAIIDNVGPGGMLAAVDTETGLVYADAADERGHVFPVHPDTGFVFKGFQIPQWEELKKMVLEIAPTFPGVRLNGWDVALSKDKGWQVIEGNSRGALNALQISTKTGCRKQLEAVLEWDKHYKKLQ